MQVRLSRTEALGVRNGIYRAGIHMNDHALRETGVKLTKELRETKDVFVTLNLSLETLEKIRGFESVAEIFPVGA